ncbi:MAG TPA: DNA polymerase III subunit epsilon [Rhodanobacteraceae bacterium]|nr:DNA polymerase III subunit epsilon [Rhodanobacteraceae bacterium]
MSRKVVLDTETTGIELAQGNRIIEVACVEIVDRRITRRQYQAYVNPQHKVEAGAFAVHGLSDEFLAEKPLFESIAGELLDFIDGAELVIHNAEFDIGFLDAEFARLAAPRRRLREMCPVIDTLPMARAMFPGQRVTLDALCKRYDINNSARKLHGALLDAQLLAEVYLALTAGQTSFDLALEAAAPAAVEQIDVQRVPRHVLRADAAEQAAHAAWLDQLDKQVEGGSVWRRQDDAGAPISC